MRERKITSKITRMDMQSQKTGVLMWKMHNLIKITKELETESNKNKVILLSHLTNYYFAYWLSMFA